MTERNEPTLRYSIFCDSSVLKSIKRSAINIRRSMFDVQSIRSADQAEFHINGAAET
jgi:hypothetical protein